MVLQQSRFVLKLRERKFDIWIAFPNNLANLSFTLRSILMARLTGAEWAYGWRIGTIRWAAQAQSECFQFPNEVERCMAIVKKIDVNPLEVVFPLPLNTCHMRVVDRLVEKHSLKGSHCVAIAPGAKRSTNRWPAERFGTVAKHLVECGLSVILLGGDSDVEICEKIVEIGGKEVINLAGQTSVLESCELLKRCLILICNDSGAQHLAVAVGTPCVSLFSFWQLRGKWWPHGTENTVLQKWVDCHTCFLDTCPFDNRCIKLIETDEVIECVKSRITQMRT